MDREREREREREKVGRVGKGCYTSPFQQGGEEDCAREHRVE